MSDYTDEKTRTESEPLLPTTSAATEPKTLRSRRIKELRIVLLTVICLYFMLVVALIADDDDEDFYDGSSQSVAELKSCAWDYLEDHVGLLDVPPISRDEFLLRQSTLAKALSNAGVDAFIAEPSASSAYYANISYNYELSERPFLLILDKDAQFSYLVPKFEAGVYFP